MTYTNLEKTTFPEKFAMTIQVESLLNAGDQDAYSLSMPLLVSAQLGNRKLYTKASILMTKVMSTMKEDPFKAWIYGRMLLAAHNIKDSYAETRIKRTLTNLVEYLLKDEATRLDRFTTWLLGYLAAVSKKEFIKVREPMLEGARHQTENYLKIKSSTASEEEKQGVRSDALWSWIMIAQAAANADEKEDYEDAITQMLIIADQSLISDALSTGLLRTAASNDYPAWAMAIIRMAAQTIGDNDRFEELAMPLKKSINEAKSAGKLQEFLLASVNEELAITRLHAMGQCALSKL